MHQIHLAFEVEPLQLNGTSPDQSVTWAGLHSTNFIVWGRKTPQHVMLSFVGFSINCCRAFDEKDIKLHFKIKKI